VRVFVSVAIILAAAPFGLPLFAMTLLTEALILGLLAMSLDLMVGYTKLISFGHAAAPTRRDTCCCTRPYHCHSRCWPPRRWLAW